MGHSDSSASMRMGHMEELFLEADANLKEVRLGAENVALDAAGELAETHGDVVDRRMKQRLGKNPLFRELMDYMEAVAMGPKTEDKRVLETGVAHFDSVLAASLKTMMLEVTFSRNDLQRQTSLSRVHAWFQDKLKARNALRERAGFPSDNAVFRDEQKNEKRSRRDLYENQMNNNRILFVDEDGDAWARDGRISCRFYKDGEWIEVPVDTKSLKLKTKYIVILIRKIFYYWYFSLNTLPVTIKVCKLL